MAVSPLGDVASLFHPSGKRSGGVKEATKKKEKKKLSKQERRAQKREKKKLTEHLSGFAPRLCGSWGRFTVDKRKRERKQKGEGKRGFQNGTRRGPGKGDFSYQQPTRVQGSEDSVCKHRKKGPRGGNKPREKQYETSKK